jgi:hypothetical protein
MDRILIVLVAFGLSAAPAQAGPNRTWVSGLGTDSGTCTLALPCRTFAFAITQTNANGEIDVLDPAGYGTVTIANAISIVNDGVGVAAIGAPTGNGITINAGPGDSIHLRGLTIEGLGSGANGIQFNTGLSLAIENCVIRGFGGAGINISPSTLSSFSVSNTIASNNGGTGILVTPIGSAAVTGVLSQVTTNNNVDGIILDGVFTTGASLKVTIVDSEASNNTIDGVLASTAAGQAPIAVMLRNSVASNNGVGLSTFTATLRVGHSVVTGNATGVGTSGGTIDIYGDNDIDGNTSNYTGVPTTIPTH